MDVFGYTRYNDLLDNTSIEAQEDEIVSYCKTNGFTLVGWLSDHCSGFEDTRPGLGQALNGQLPNSVTGIVVTALTRLSLDAVLQNEIQRRLAALGIEVIAAS